MNGDTAPIRFDAVTKRYVRGIGRKPFLAVDGVAFSVGRGEVVGYLGRNGAGKTTTFKLLFGLVSPTSGRALLAGRDPRERGARRKAGFLPENPTMYDHLTGRESVAFAARLQGLGRAEAASSASALLERVGMRDAADVAIREMSKGMRQRVGLAQALVGDPDVLVLDEPLEGLDPLGRRDLKGLIRDLRRPDRAVLLSSHILSDVEALCDRVVVIEKGRILAEGSLESLVGGRVAAYEVTARGLRPEAAAALRARARAARDEGDRLHATLDGGADPDEVARLVRDGGGRLEALVPVRESLEDVFASLLGKAP
ncbi:MAG: ABC transporter ATP-binding protein [Planctomycetales bacterium]|nr:ABC transporter ATP-binding protein [Planctomycetales bacterium]